MMVHIRPRVSFGLPSTMSSARMFTSLIFLYRRKSRAICTFCNMWKRIRPLSRGWKNAIESPLITFYRGQSSSARSNCRAWLKRIQCTSRYQRHGSNSNLWNRFNLNGINLRSKQHWLYTNSNIWQISFFYFWKLNLKNCLEKLHSQDARQKALPKGRWGCDRRVDPRIDRRHVCSPATNSKVLS